MKSSHSILVVADEASIAADLTGILRRLGHEVVGIAASNIRYTPETLGVPRKKSGPSRSVSGVGTGSRRSCFAALIQASVGDLREWNCIHFFTPFPVAPVNVIEFSPAAFEVEQFTHNRPQAVGVISHRNRLDQAGLGNTLQEQTDGRRYFLLNWRGALGSQHRVLPFAQDIEIGVTGFGGRLVLVVRFECEGVLTSTVADPDVERG